MSIELVAAGSAIAVSLFGGLFNYYKLKDDQETWEQDQKISINKKILFRTLKKRYKHYGRVFELLGEVRDIEYPQSHYQELKNDKQRLIKTADLILKELYGEAGLFMSYETRSAILKVYQNSYRFAKDEIVLNELVDSYYIGRRALRKDLEFDDSKTAQSSQKILKNTKAEEVEESDFKWRVKNKLAYSPRPGYPTKAVDIVTLNTTMRLWKEKGIKSIICLLSDEEIGEYYEVINYDLIGFYKKNGFEVFHMSIADFKKPPVSLEQFEVIFQEQNSLTQPILVHCGAGQDRSGTTVAYLEEKYQVQKKEEK